MALPAPDRRWFPLSLRTLFALVTIFGLWLGLQAKWVRDRRAAQEWIQSQGGDFVKESGPFVIRQPDTTISGSGLRIFDHPQPPWSIRLFGAETVYWIVVPRTGGDEFVDAKMRELTRLFPEAEVRERD